MQVLKIESVDVVLQQRLAGGCVWVRLLSHVSWGDIPGITVRAREHRHRSVEVGGCNLLSRHGIYGHDT